MHPHRLSLFVIAPFLSIALLIPTASAQTGSGKARAELKQLLKLYEGDYDNYQQVIAEQERKLAKPRAQIHFTIKRVAAAAFGADVYYFRVSLKGQPALRRLVSFRINETAKQIESLSYAFSEQAQALAADNDAGALSLLKPEQMLPACVVYWRREGERFSSAVKPGDCPMPASGDDDTNALADNLALTSDELLAHNERFKRCAFYEGTVTLRGESGKPPETIRLVIHDQGQIAPLAPAGEQSIHALQLAQVAGKDGRPMLRLSLLEKGEVRAFLDLKPGERIIFNNDWLNGELKRRKLP
jgi:hypothetical protein